MDYDNQVPPPQPIGTAEANPFEQLFQGMQQQLGMLTHLVQQQQEQLAAVSNSIPSHPQLSTSSSKKSALKISAPDVFDGKIGNSATFLHQLNLYFNGKDIADDRERVVMALSYMKGGTAGPWAKVKTEEYNLIPFSWESFVVAFKTAFWDPDPAGTAQYKMELLKQGTQTADEYVASFNELKADTGFNDVALADKFQKGLNQALVDKIYNLPEMPSNLAEWMHWATKLDRQWRQREARKKMSIGQKSSSVPSKPTRSPTLPQTLSAPFTSKFNQQPDVVPMEIDSGWKKIKPLVCFKCRKPGHMARQCPSAVDINSIDYDGLKAYMKTEIAKEEALKQETVKKEEDVKKENF